jgi:Arc/MetJ-type ribon-helix-helix transcriptional regulator
LAAGSHDQDRQNPITSEQHAKIRAAVERGDYATTSEVIRTALREWELKEELRRLEGERIASSGTRASPADLWLKGLRS